MKRYSVSLQEIGSFQNLMLAANKAARGKRDRGDVQDFFNDLDKSLTQLSENILLERAPIGAYRYFTIFDPKKRLIHAACFEDRVLHHALMNRLAPRIERAMIEHSYACRVNKGVLKAAKQVQHYLQRYPWYVKIDIDGYFAAIDHKRLNALLQDTFKGKALLDLLARIIHSYSVTADKGLPIGSLTSQHFANLYLDEIDRMIQETPQVRGYVRYMDDMIWWCQDKQHAKVTLALFSDALSQKRALSVKPSVQINRSKKGVTYCGFRMTMANLRLTRRKKLRYQSRRAYWENEYKRQRITVLDLQRNMSAVQAVTAHTDSESWRRANLTRFPAIDV